MEFIFKYIRTERPLFYEYAHEIIEGIMENGYEFNSDKQALSFLFEMLLMMYRKAKGNPDLFNIGQLAYMCSYCSNGPNVAVSDEILRSDLYIHGHLAYLKANFFDLQEPYFSIVTVNISNQEYVRRYMIQGAGGKLMLSQRPFEIRFIILA